MDRVLKSGKEEIKYLLKDFLLYGMSIFLTSGISFFLLPILTKFLSPKDYGIVSLFQSFFNISLILIGLGMENYVKLIYFKEPQFFKENLVNVLSIAYLNSVSLIFLGIIMNATPVMNSMLPDFPHFLFLVAFFSGFCGFLGSLYLTIQQIKRQTIMYIKFQMSQFIINVFLSLFLVYIGLKWIGRISGIVSSYLLTGFWVLFWIYRRENIKIKGTFLFFKNTRRILRFSLPTILHSLGSWMITNVDKLFINKMIGIEEVGIYSVGYKIGMVIGILAAAFNRAWVPYFFSKLSLKDRSCYVRIVKITYIYFVIILLASLVWTLFSRILINVVLGTKYRDAQNYVLWISLAYALNGMYFMVVNYIFFAEKTIYLSFIIPSSALLNVVLDYFFIKYFGAVGAAIATTITYAVIFLVTWVLSNKVYKMPWRVMK